MPRPIVVEGPDGAGKSTLVGQLSRSLGLEPTHTGGPIKSEEEGRERLDRIEALIDAGPCLFDRIPHISSPIYERVLYGREYVPQEECWKRLFEMDPIIIYCRLASVPVMRANVVRSSLKTHKPQEHLVQVLHHYERLVDEYDDTMLVLREFVIRFNWQVDSLARLTETIRCVD